MRGVLLICVLLGGIALGACDVPFNEPFWSPYRIEGTVLDQDGHPVNGVDLTLRDPAGAVVTTTTPFLDEAGSFLFLFIGNGEHTISIRTPPGFTVPTEQQNPVRVTVRDASVSLVITLRRLD